MNLDYIVENYLSEGIINTKEMVDKADSELKADKDQKALVAKYEKMFNAIRDALVKIGFKEGTSRYYMAFDKVISSKFKDILDPLKLKNFSNKDPRGAARMPTNSYDMERRNHEKFMRTISNMEKNEPERFKQIRDDLLPTMRKYTSSGKLNTGFESNRAPSKELSSAIVSTLRNLPTDSLDGEGVSIDKGRVEAGVQKILSAADSLADKSAGSDIASACRRFMDSPKGKSDYKALHDSLFREYRVIARTYPETRLTGASGVGNGGHGAEMAIPLDVKGHVYAIQYKGREWQVVNGKWIGRQLANGSISSDDKIKFIDRLPTVKGNYTAVSIAGKNYAVDSSDGGIYSDYLQQRHAIDKNSYGFDNTESYRSNVGYSKDDTSKSVQNNSFELLGRKQIVAMIESGKITENNPAIYTGIVPGDRSKAYLNINGKTYLVNTVNINSAQHGGFMTVDKYKPFFKKDFSRKANEDMKAGSIGESSKFNY
jgi:hypothetical protein